MSRVDELFCPLKHLFSDGRSSLLLGLVIIGLLVGFSWPVRGRIDGEVDTELWLTPGESPFGEKSVTNFRADYLEGNLADYPNKLATALYWPNTNNTLFDTGLALSGNLKTPLAQEEPSASAPLDLRLDGYFARDFGPDYPVGTAGGSSRASFGEEEMDYWVTKGIVNYGGFSYRGVFLLEEIHESSPAILRGVSPQVIYGTMDEISAEGRAELEQVMGNQGPDPGIEDISAGTLKEILEAIPAATLTEELGTGGNYGSGLELALSGMKVSGVSVELKTRLGLAPNPQEMVGDDPGSGYDTFGAHGRYLGYTGSEVELNGIELGPARFDATSSFTAESGFEETKIDFSLQEESGILEFEGTMKYTPGEKTLSLDPSLDLKWVCFDLYSEVRSSELTKEGEGLTGVSIKGYGMEELQLGNAKASFIQALGDNKLQRKQGRDDWRLRASDYGLYSEEEYSYSGRSFSFGKTVYQGALSLEGGGGNLELAVDSYWGPDPVLFGFSEFTGEAKYRITNSFELILGMVLRAGEGLQGVIVNTIYRW